MKSYTAKPKYRGENKSATYISGDFSAGKHPFDGLQRDAKSIFSFNAHRSTTHKHFNFHYGLGGAFGSYKFKTDYNDGIRRKERKPFYNVNAKAGFNFNLPRRKIDWRFFGIEFTYHNEFGPFQDKLQEIKDNTDELVFNKKSIYAYNINSEAVFKLKDGNVIGFGFFVGDILNKTGNLKGRDSALGGIMVSFKTKKFTFSILKENGAEDIGSTKFGLSYQVF